MKQRHDDTIDRTLSRLAAAQPPDGMEARIQQRLQYRALRYDDAIRLGWRPNRAWWLGMLTGATLAGLLCSLILLGPWRARPHRAEQAANTAAVPHSESTDHLIMPVSTGTTNSTPCTHPISVRRMQRREAAATRLAQLHPVTQEPGLTREEQQLVRLVHVARPAALANLSFEARAQLDQQETAAFQKFFTPPPPPPQDTGVTE